MASVENSFSPSEQKAWNEAYVRLTHYLESFCLVDRAHVARLALKLQDQAQQIYRHDISKAPTPLTMELAQKTIAEWLAANLDEPDKAPSKILADGCIALLISQVFRTAPESFLANPLPEELRQALRETLLVTGPDLNISSMTPRHLDYGPMLGIARQTWHRWDTKAFLIALFFWTCVYAILYCGLSQIL